jgi:hypothetical protein
MNLLGSIKDEKNFRQVERSSTSQGLCSIKPVIEKDTQNDCPKRLLIVPETRKRRSLEKSGNMYSNLNAHYMVP